MTQISADSEQPSSGGALGRVTEVALYVSIGVAIALMVYAAMVTDTSRVAAALGALVVLGAPIAVGSVAGFLFGVPESVRELTRQRPAPSAPASPGSPAPAGNAPATSAALGRDPVTQLVQIADWLTKILVGATVTQLDAIPALVQGTGEYASFDVLGHTRGEAVMGAAIIYGAAFGFYFGYLSTRLVLNAAFRQAETGTESPESLPPIERAQVLSERSGPGAEAPPSPAARRIASFNSDRLSDPSDLMAWGMARLAVDRRDAAALPALESATLAAPDDRRAVEGLVFAALYRDPPFGFRKAIAEAPRYLERHLPPVADDGPLYAYLACGHGQAYAWEKSHDARPDELSAARDGARDAAKQAIALDEKWRSFLRNLASPPPGGDDDLAVLAADDSVLRNILGI